MAASRSFGVSTSSWRDAANKALDEAGHRYETKQVKGGIMKLWTLPSRAKVSIVNPSIRPIGSPIAQNTAHTSIAMIR